MVVVAHCAGISPILDKFQHVDGFFIRESMAGCPPPPLLQNRACDFHRTRLLSDVILGMDIVRTHQK